MNEELDERLKRLALAAQIHPPESPERRECLNRLICAINKSGQKFPLNYPSGYEQASREIYDIAIQMTYISICQNIDKYQPERGEVLTWVTGIFRNRTSDAIREICNPGKNMIWTKIPRLSLDDLERSSNENFDNQSDSTPSVSEEIIQVIREDPEGLFEKRTMRTYPNVNWKWLCLRLFEGYSWKEIAKEVGCQVSAISNFYQRSLKKFIPIIKQYLNP